MTEAGRSDEALPDLTLGVSIDSLPDGGTLQGRAGDDEVLLVRRGDEIFAVGPHCTHYHGPLREGLVVDDTVRCPWHHACFSLRTGEAVRAPALDPIARWLVQRDGSRVIVRAKLGGPSVPRVSPSASASWPASVVIVGGGAAGLAAADILRREGYDRPITMLSADDSPPCDRPNLSKDYLAGTAQEDWIPLRAPEFYDDHHITLRLSSRVSAVDVAGRTVRLEQGDTIPFGALLLATGAEPVRLSVPGADRAHVRYLRTFADSRAIIAATGTAKRAAVIGASFIGLEVAASLIARGLQVTVVAPESTPMERILGPRVGHFIRNIHESHGVRFKLGHTVAQIEESAVMLEDGTRIDADLVVVGIGVRPAVGLAERAGLAVDRGVAVNEYLETSAPGIFAAGDIARWPDPHTGERIRVEHWVVAERQGQAAARNILGRRERFDAVPFFWSQHYDVPINYVGHAASWDEVDIDGDLEGRDCRVTYRGGTRALAVATVYRDMESLRAELAIEGS